MNFKIFFYLGAWPTGSLQQGVLQTQEFAGKIQVSTFLSSSLEMLGFCGFRVETVIRKKRNIHRIENSFFLCEKDSKMDQSNICHMFTGIFCFWLIQFVSGFADAVYVLDDKYSSTVTPVWLQRGRKIIYAVTTSPQTPRNLFFGMW